MFPFFTNGLTRFSATRERGLDVTNEQTILAEIAELERRIRELRRMHC